MLEAAELIEALHLPASCRVDQRVPKKMLIENGAPTTADKRLLNDAIAEIQWVAALKQTGARQQSVASSPKPETPTRAQN